jgi:CDP-diacylglycerol--glycerol-3-phosphate 3-phosphatidyltransferase
MATSLDETVPSAPRTLPRTPPITPPISAPEHLWNLPNSITMLRAAVVPVLLLFPGAAGNRLGSQLLASLFIVAAVTDLLDGWLARRGQQVTKIGKLIDPLADKLLVATALIVLLAGGRIPAWGTPMVVIIIGRELAVTGLRGFAQADGHIMPAEWSGKAKTLLQNIAIGALLFPTPQWGLPAHTVGLWFLVAATALTLWSGYGYFASYFGEAGLRARRENQR